MHDAFGVHMLNEQGKAKAKRIAEAFDTLLGTIQEVAPAGRELSVIITKLEEACFLAKKAMAKNAENQQ